MGTRLTGQEQLSGWVLCDPPEGTEMSLSVGADAFCAECSDVTRVVLGWSIPFHASRVLDRWLAETSRRNQRIHHMNSIHMLHYLASR